MSPAAPTAVARQGRAPIHLIARPGSRRAERARGALARPRLGGPGSLRRLLDGNGRRLLDLGRHGSPSRSGRAPSGAGSTACPRSRSPNRGDTSSARNAPAARISCSTCVRWTREGALRHAADMPRTVSRRSRPGRPGSRSRAAPMRSAIGSASSPRRTPAAAVAIGHHRAHRRSGRSVAIDRLSPFRRPGSDDRRARRAASHPLGRGDSRPPACGAPHARAARRPRRHPGSRRRPPALLPSTGGGAQRIAGAGRPVRARHRWDPPAADRRTTAASRSDRDAARRRPRARRRWTPRAPSGPGVSRHADLPLWLRGRSA